MPRIAFLPDSFHEVNGVAHTARNFVAFAERRSLPMLCIRAGPGRSQSGRHGSVETLELPRSRWAVQIEKDLAFDPFFFRHARAIGTVLRGFRPEVIHITGPSELGMLGAFFAWKQGIPLVASWHTNVHEYAGRRLAHKLRGVPKLSVAVNRAIENASLAAAARLYRLARVLYAPNPPLCALLTAKAGRPCYLMQRGVDTALFSPDKRDGTTSRPLTLGYVGRLSIEKNVALLPRIDHSLRNLGVQPRWLIVGHGAAEPALREEFGPSATFTGVLRGEDLARAYAEMDLLVFPSHTDTFGNVVLEALASGTPAIVTGSGGPAFIVQNGITGRVCAEEEFAPAIADLAAERTKLSAMRLAARAYALQCSWDSVFEQVLAAYPVP